VNPLLRCSSAYSKEEHDGFEEEEDGAQAQAGPREGSRGQDYEDRYEAKKTGRRRP
jgi:hypothetical protein